MDLRASPFSLFFYPLYKYTTLNYIPNSIFELQSRTLSSLMTIFLLGPLFAVITPYYFATDPIHLFFTYVVPVIPFVLAFDGYVSSMRTRTVGEVLALLDPEGAGSEERGLAVLRERGWSVRSGQECHTWPTGYMSWIVGVKERDGK